MEAGAREAVQERGEIRRFPGLEAARQEGAVRRLEACRDRPVSSIRPGVPSTPAHAVQTERPAGAAGRFGEGMVGSVRSGRDDPSVPVGTRYFSPSPSPGAVSSRRGRRRRSRARTGQARPDGAPDARRGLLAGNPDGMRPKDIAERLGMSVRNVYRDLRALETEVELPTWAEGGRWGILGDRRSCRRSSSPCPRRWRCSSAPG